MLHLQATSGLTFKLIQVTANVLNSSKKLEEKKRSEGAMVVIIREVNGA